MSLLPVGISGEAQYQISRSLRFNSADSAYLNRTFSTPTNVLKWTWSGWVKRGKLGTSYAPLFAGGTSGSAYAAIWFQSDNLVLFSYNGSTVYQLTTSAVYRDPSAWYHIQVAFDSTQATSSDRLSMYVNGSKVTAFSTATYPSLNYSGFMNSAIAHYIGQFTPALGSNYFDGYLTEVNFIDGQALTPSSFGETDIVTGVWKPKKYTGSYSGNSFYLNFSDNSGTTSTTLGKDSSGLGNNWTPNNFSVTAGVGNDSLVDTPTPYGTDTGVGGEVRGNYATLNPISATNQVRGTIADGNLTGTVNTTAPIIISTFEIPTNLKIYVEFIATSGISSAAAGLTDVGVRGFNNNYTQTDVATYLSDAKKTVDNVTTSYGATYTNANVIGMAIDAANKTVEFFKDGATQGIVTWSTTYTTLCVGMSARGSTAGARTGSWNFGQRPFAYTAPSGFKALCTQNLPEPVIKDGGDYFNTILYTGTGSSNARTGVGFQPDFVWIKGRSGATDHGLYDAVRGVQKQLETNNTGAETTETTGLTAFGSDGFTVGALAQLNTSSATYVAWNWKANGAGSSNTAGTITSTVSVNTTSGFSIVTYTGNGTNSSTVGHGLGVVPGFIVVKERSGGTYAWNAYHSALGAGKYLSLNTTNASATDANVYPTVSSTTFGLTTGANLVVQNATGVTYVAYCFAPVAGYSAFGSYLGNSSNDGPFIFCNFRPRWVLIKCSSAADSWYILDTVRDTYNVMGSMLVPSSANAENVAPPVIDVLSNGFKIRSSSYATANTYIYAAFAENPFKYSLAR